MEKEKSLLNYYLRGFTLTNKSLDVYLLAVVLASLTLLPSLLPDSAMSRILLLPSMLFAIIDLGFSLSIPIFLLYKQQNKSLNFQTIISTTIQNTKRIILPAILIFILLLILLVVSVVLTAIFLHPAKEQVTQFSRSWSQFSKGWNPIFLILPIIFSLFTFTPFLFALERKGLLVSIKNSFMMSFRHLPYLSLVMVIGAISYSITSFLPTGVWGLFIRNPIRLYISLIATASTLFYYQKNIKDGTNL